MRGYPARAADTIHIYLRSDLFAEEGQRFTLAPLLGVQDPILEHLGRAVGEAVQEKLTASSLFVDSIAHGMARRFLVIGEHGAPEPDRTYRLSERQIQRIREFVEANLETDLRLEAMARACGLGTKTFLRSFRATRTPGPLLPDDCGPTPRPRCLRAS